MSDDNMDKLFKEAAEKHQPEYNSSNWEKMSALLDNYTPPAGSGGSSMIGWKGIASVITLAIVGSVLYYSVRYDDSQPGNAVSELPVTASNSNTAELNDLSSKDKVVEDVGIGDHLTNSAAIASNEPVSRHASGTETGRNKPSIEGNVHNDRPVSLRSQVVTSAENVAINESANSAVMQKDLPGESGEPEIVNSRTEKSSDKDPLTNPTQANSLDFEIKENDRDLERSDDSKLKVNQQTANVIAEVESPSKQQVVSADKDNEKNRVTNPSTTEEVANPLNTSAVQNKGSSSVLVNSSDEEETDDESETSQKEVVDQVDNSKKRDESEGASAFPRGFSIRFGVSPDFSSVNFKPSSGVGFNIGLLGEYRFSNRWSVSTGVLTAKKVYSGSNVEYETSNNQTYVADEMEGGCTVIDIPVNVSYTFGNPNRTSFFVTTGLSSYLMMNENYTWSYDNGTSFDVTATRENNDWFKQLNISVGAQRKLNNHFFVQFEPFVKAPLAGVGEGKVSLTSLGAFINLRYSFNK